MATEAMIGQPARGRAAAVPGVLCGPEMTREALRLYAWPFTARAAGYITIVAALASTLLKLYAVAPVSIAACTALAGAFQLGFHWLSCRQDLMGARERALVFGGQVLCAGLIQFLADDIGPFLFYFLLAAELQFLTPYRPALVGTVLLWVGAVTNEIMVATHGHRLDLFACTASLAGFVFIAAFTRSAVVEIVQRHEATLLLDQLNAAHDQLRRHVAEVEELTVARERNRMARDIHDTLGHYLTVINVQLETAQKLVPRDPARGTAALDTAKSLASECLGEVRRSVTALRPADLDAVAFPEAIARLVDDLRRTADLTIHVETRGAGTLPPAAEVAVYRAVQEALTNVRKHAAARNVWLSTEWGTGAFTAAVRDDGCGASATTATSVGGTGLRGMRERLGGVGGTLEAGPLPNGGYHVALRVPHMPGNVGAR